MENESKQIDSVSPVQFSHKYPLEWYHPCFPSKANDKTCVLQQMQYWSKGVAAVKSTPSVSTKYVTFLKDCGGFNNIRQGFEFHAMIAWLTQRTLVLPPDSPWYLIDFGSITRGKEDKNAKTESAVTAWPSGKARIHGVSNYDIWFDLDDMSKAVPVITADEFIRREYRNLNIPNEFYGGDIVNQDIDVGNAFTKWLTDKATEMNVILPWAQLNNYIAWPSVESVTLKNAAQINDDWIDGRAAKTYTSFLQQQPFIHFPSCHKNLPNEDPEMSNYRYLGQIARSVAFDEVEMDRKFKQVLRDHVHLKADIMQYAALVIEILGAFKYSSLHIRRNELQYKYVWCTAHDSYQHIQPLIGENEVLYIATDETQPGFFKVFEENGRRKVFQWKDFFGAEAKFEQTKYVEIPHKLHGEVEMVICAMARMFFGTKESTFSSYIGRLRGYLNAPYTQILYHHYQLTSDADKSEEISRFSDWGKPYKGKIYKIPFKDLWEDITDLP